MCATTNRDGSDGVQLYQSDKIPIISRWQNNELRKILSIQHHITELATTGTSSTLFFLQLWGDGSSQSFIGSVVVAAEQYQEPVLVVLDPSQPFDGG
jgi:hypothetical protein